MHLYSVEVVYSFPMRTFAAGTQHTHVVDPGVELDQNWPPDNVLEEIARRRLCAHDAVYAIRGNM